MDCEGGREGWNGCIEGRRMQGRKDGVKDMEGEKDISIVEGRE